MKKAVFGFLAASLLSFTSHAQSSTVTSGPTTTPTSPEAAAPASQPANPSEALTIVPTPEWKAKLTWSGDVRVRHNRVKSGDAGVQPKNQLRVRAGLKADVNEQVQAVLRLATGTSAIGTNQDLGDQKAPGMPRRNFGLDLGYIDWSFTKEGHVWAGRTANPFWAPGKSQLIYDGDLAFEGASLKWEPQWETSSMFVNLGSSIVSEEYDNTAKEDAGDVAIVGAQVGYSVKAAGTWTVHVATHQFENLQGKSIMVTGGATAASNIDNGSSDRFKGNRLALGATNVYANKYNLMEYGLEYKGKFDPVEVTAYVDYVKNSGASDENTGTETGLLVKYGSAQVGYALIEKKADAVVGVFTDSDTNGGGTDNKGSRASLAYLFGKNSQVAVNHYTGKRQVSLTESNYSRTDLDFLVSF